jgi:hypothetical protein
MRASVFCSHHIFDLKGMAQAEKCLRVTTGGDAVPLATPNAANRSGIGLRLKALPRKVAQG